jgi:hypothetical protein
MTARENFPCRSDQRADFFPVHSTTSPRQRALDSGAIAIEIRYSSLPLTRARTVPGPSSRCMTDPLRTYMDSISQKYAGKPFPFRNPEGRVALVIEVEKARCTKLPFEHTPLTRG